MATPYSLLAPVPRVHLESALSIAATVPHICFGSDKYDFFRQLDVDSNGLEVPILICATGVDIAGDTFRASWMGIYGGSTEDPAEKRTEERADCLPPSAVANRKAGIATEEWGVLWRVRSLQRVPTANVCGIGEFENWSSGTRRVESALRAPQRIVCPDWLPSAVGL